MLDLSAGILAIVIVCIIYIYNDLKLTSFQNIMFNSWVIINLLALFHRILFLIFFQKQLVSTEIIILIETISLIIIPMTSLVYFIYIAYLVMGKQVGKGKKRLIFIACSPYIIYIIIIVMNLYNKKIFDITSNYNYIRGTWFNLVFCIYYLYCLIGFFLVLFRRKSISNVNGLIMIFFPALSLLVFFLESLFPKLFFSGLASSCSVLVVYLYLQNTDKVKDHLTNLLNRQEFMKVLESKVNKNNESFTVISWL